MSSVLIGNLTRDPELSYLPNGTAVCKLGLAIEDKYQKDGETQTKVAFVDVDCWGFVAEAAAAELKKGNKAIVVAKLKQDNWEKDGQKYSKICFTGLQVGKVCWAPRDGDKATTTASAGAGKSSSNKPAADPPDEDIPF